MENREVILVLAPHADDAEIGMGGTIARYVSQGKRVVLINLITPCEHLDGSIDLEFKRKRKTESIASAEILGVELVNLEIDPYEFTYSREYVKYFDSIIAKYSPSEIYFTWENDTYQDHQSLAKIVYSSSRKNRCSLVMYETMIPGGITNVSFKPQKFINISGHIEEKLRSICAYHSVFGDKPQLVKAIEGRSKYRGSQIGVEYAECFEVVKWIEL